jgi:hypothetical protein
MGTTGTIILPDPTTAVGSEFIIYNKFQDPGTVTIQSGGTQPNIIDLIGGFATSITMQLYSCYTFISDGENYYRIS